MSRNDYSAELLKMEGVEIEKIEEDAEEIVIHVCLGRKAQTCKHCGQPTDRVHDYRVRQVRDLELRGKPLRLMYRQRRYECLSCGKRFSEANDFVGRYMRFTHRTGEKIMNLLRRRSSMKDVAKDTGTSVSGVQRVLKMMPTCSGRISGSPCRTIRGAALECQSSQINIRSVPVSTVDQRTLPSFNG